MRFRSIKTLILAAVALIAMMLPAGAGAQRVAIKTNALEYLVLTPNLGVEARLSRTLSLQLNFSCNPVSHAIGGYSLAHFRVEPELRYWFNRPMARHFIALSANMAAFDCRFNDRYFKGDAVAAGISYGYAWVLSKHWNMEAEIGLGLASVKAYNYRGANNRPAQKNYSKVLPVPVRCALSFSYIF